MIKLEHPILTNEDLEKLRQRGPHRFQAGHLPILSRRARAGWSVRPCADVGKCICRRVDIILRRVASAGRDAPIPALHSP